MSVFAEYVGIHTVLRALGEQNMNLWMFCLYLFF